MNGRGAEALAWSTDKQKADCTARLKEENRQLRNRVLSLEDDVRAGKRRAQDARELGGTPASAMAMTLFHCFWLVPQDRGEAFANEYFRALQDNIVSNLEKSAAAVGARIVWDESVTNAG